MKFVVAVVVAYILKLRISLKKFIKLNHLAKNMLFFTSHGGSWGVGNTLHNSLSFLADSVSNTITEAVSTEDDNNISKCDSSYFFLFSVR